MLVSIRLSLALPVRKKMLDPLNYILSHKKHPTRNRVIIDRKISVLSKPGSNHLLGYPWLFLSENGWIWIWPSLTLFEASHVYRHVSGLQLTWWSYLSNVSLPRSLTRVWSCVGTTSLLTFTKLTNLLTNTVVINIIVDFVVGKNRPTQNRLF